MRGKTGEDLEHPGILLKGRWRPRRVRRELGAVCAVISEGRVQPTKARSVVRKGRRGGQRRAWPDRFAGPGEPTHVPMTGPTSWRMLDL